MATQAGASKVDGQRAVTSIKQSLEVQPERALFWSNLGVACSVADEFQEAIEAFHKSDQLRGKIDWEHRTFYARALEGLGKQDVALERYCEGWLWIQANLASNPQYQRFLSETEARLGLNADTRDGVLREFPPPTRKAIYTTNAIETVNSMIRKFTRNRTQYPNESSALKMIYMAISEASKRSTMPIHHWKQALNHFAIMYEDCMPELGCK